jgi:hypothetical protein
MCILFLKLFLYDLTMPILAVDSWNSLLYYVFFAAPSDDSFKNRLHKLWINQSYSARDMTSLGLKVELKIRI